MYLQFIVTIGDEVLIVRGKDDLLELLVRKFELELFDSVRNGSRDAESSKLGDGPDPRHNHAFVLVVVQHHLEGLSIYDVTNDMIFFDVQSNSVQRSP